MTIVFNERIRDAQSLESARGHLHDADFDAAEISFDRERRRLTLPFEQEPWGDLHGAPRRAIRQRLWWATDYDVPYVRGCLVVNQVEELRLADGFGTEGNGMLTGLDWTSGRRLVTIRDDVGARIDATVRKLDLGITITSCIGHWKQRRYVRVIPMTITRGRADVPRSET